MTPMTPELKAYIDEWMAELKAYRDERKSYIDKWNTERKRDFAAPAVSINTSAAVPASCVTSPVVGSDTADLALASAGLAEPAAPIPAIGEPRTAAPGAPETTDAMVPVTCSTECAGQVVTAATTTTLLPGVSVSSSSTTTSATNDMASTELGSNNDADENGASFASSSLSSSTTQFTAWEDASPTARTSYTDQIEWGHLGPVDTVWSTINAEAGVLMCFKSEHNNIFPTCGVTAMALLQEGVSELVHVQEVFPVSATPTDSGKRALEVVPSAFVGVITTVPTTCATHCSVQQPRAVRWMIASSPPTPTKYNNHELFRLSSSWPIASRVQVRRPTPWPSFKNVHANGDETRPRPWPSFISHGGGGLEKQSGLTSHVRYKTLMQWEPGPSKKPTWLTTKNLGAQEWFVVTAGRGGCQKQCYHVQLQAAVQDTPNALKELSSEQQESEQWPKCSSEPPKNSILDLISELAFPGATGFGLCKSLPALTENNYVWWESDIVPHQVQFIQQIRYHASSSCPVTGACKGAMELGIQWLFSFVSAEFQFKIAWIPTRPATVMKLQKLSCKCSYSVGAHLTSTTVCHTIVSAEGNMFRNPPYSQSGDSFQYQGSSHVEPTSSRCQVSTVNAWIHTKAFTHCLKVRMVMNVLHALECVGSGNAEMQGTMEHMDIAAHWQFLRQEEFEGSGKFSSDSMPISNATTQCLLSTLMSRCLPSNIHTSALSKIMRLCQTSMAGHQGVIALFLSVPTDLEIAANQHWHISWDPGGYMLADAFRIWLVAWNLDDLVFSTGSGQTPFQGRMDIFRPAFCDQVQVTNDYYIASSTLISIDYYLNTVCSPLMYYHDCQGDSGKTEEIHMPWDPGKSALTYALKVRLGDKPSFKERGMLGPSRARLSGPLPWAHNGRFGPAQIQPQVRTYKYPRGVNEELIQRITNGNGGRG